MMFLCALVLKGLNSPSPSKESFGLVYDAVWPSHMGTITGVINCRLGEGTKANLSLDSEIKSKRKKNLINLLS